MINAPSSVPISVASAKATARSSGLRYVNDAGEGISRKKKGKTFAYFDAKGSKIRSDDVLGRIKSLAIPPAWTDVWICPLENGHLQATGRDARGRKQYRYHPKWRDARDGNKFSKLQQFGRKLPKIRGKLRQHLRLKSLNREKVLATVVSLLEKSLIRVGNDEYATANGSHGLTTMLDRHAKITKQEIRFSFRGKSGLWHDISVRDPKLATIVKKCQDLPGQELFQYVDGNGNLHDVTSADVNEYLHEISGADITAKDFRTWAGTVLAAMALQECEDFDTESQAKKNILSAIESVAKRLGNTPAVCRKCYIHPGILHAYLDHTMLQSARQRARHEMKTSLSRLPPEEAFVLALLERRLSEKLE